MRQIKFRAWIDGRFIYSGGEKEWIELCQFGDWEHNCLNNSGTGWAINEVQQYTGLKDKNGKEIYEGDIVKIHNYKETWKRGEPKIDWRVFEIRWNRYLWSFNNSVISKPLADYDTTDLMPYDIEIIGNIYENPELLS